MNNELIKQKSWWKRNWKWLVPVCGIILIFISIFFSSGMGGVTTNLAQAYADVELYDNAVKMAQSDARVKELLGEIQPIDKLAIIEGQVEYSDGNKTVNTTIRVIGTKGKGNLDISANRINDVWVYKIIKIRIKTPPHKKQTIEITTEDY